MAKVPLTPRGYADLESELKICKNEKRPAIIQAISEARALGDLSENAEYHAAKEEQKHNDYRVAFLENALANAEVIDPLKVACDSVKFGATCKIVDVETDEEKSYQIVGKEEADLDKGRISFESPLARAMIGKKVGDTATFNSPRGAREFEILEVAYK